MIFLLVIINLAISIFNAWSVGRSWAEAKNAGGWTRFMSWMGGVMSAVGFTWIYLILAAEIFGPGGLGKLNAKYVEGMWSLGYLAIVIPLIGSGIAITIDSWAYFWRRRTWGSGGLAAWNTFADIFNIVQAMETVPGALKEVSGLFSSDGDDDASATMAKWAIGLAIFAVLAGILTTVFIVRSTMKRHVYNLKLDAMLAKHEAEQRAKSA